MRKLWPLLMLLLALPIMASDVVIEFDDLDAAAKAKLKAGHQKAKKNKIFQIAIISHGEQNIRPIERYVKRIAKNVEIESFDLEERPNTFERLFSSDEAKLKELLEKAGLSLNETTFEVPGKATRSIVIFVMDEE